MQGHQLEMARVEADPAVERLQGEVAQVDQQQGCWKVLEEWVVKRCLGGSLLHQVWTEGCSAGLPQDVPHRIVHSLISSPPFPEPR